MAIRNETKTKDRLLPRQEGEKKLVEGMSGRKVISSFPPLFISITRANGYTRTFGAQLPKLITGGVWDGDHATGRAKTEDKERRIKAFHTEVKRAHCVNPRHNY